MKSKFFIALLIILEIFVAFLIYVRFGEVAYNGDALYEAQVARNIIAGKGYTTSEMPLYAVDLYQKKGLSLEAPWVNTHKFVLPVYLKFLFIRAFGDSIPSVTFLYSYFFHFLTVLLIYFLALKLWPRNYVFAFLAAFIFLVNPVLGFGTPYIMLSGLNLGVDAFFFLLFLYVMHLWWERRRHSFLFLGGLISGIAFLDRYNSGLYIVATFCVLAYILIWCREKEATLKSALASFVKQYLIYFAGFAVVAFLFLVWNLKTTGHLFLSINGLFQLLFDTKYNNFIDPWFKLEYIFPTNNPLSFALAHPLPLLVKWFKYATLDVVRFVAFENVLWWTPLVATYFLVRQRSKAVIKSIDFLLLFVITLVILQILILPLWAGSVAYFFYLFPPFSFVLAYIIFSGFSLAMAPRSSLNLRAVIEKAFTFPLGTIFRYSVVSLLALSALILLVHPSFQMIFEPLSVRGYLVGIFSLWVIGGVIMVGHRFPKYILPLVTLLGLAYFMAQIGILSAPTQAEILRARWDLEDNPNVIKSLEEYNNGGISLSLTPWNTVWWSNNSISSLPLPEYPDQIYLLEHVYNQRIDSIYLNKISLYPFKYISYAWSAYERAVQLGYTFDGFSVVRRTSTGLILKRSEEQLPLPVNIDFGTDTANSHLIWGWSKNKVEGGVDYVTAGDYVYLSQDKTIIQGTRADDKKIAKTQMVTIPDIEIKTTGGIAKWYVKPQAEVTFLAYQRPLVRARLRVRAQNPHADLTVILNGNLLYRNQPGIDLGSFNLTKNWQEIIISLPTDQLNNGVNKLSFLFINEVDFDRIDFE